MTHCKIEPMFILTNDVECFSFETNRFESRVTQQVLKQGLLRLLDLYDKYDIDATFFYTGRIVEIEPEVIDIVKERSSQHEIGCHGYTHDEKFSFDTMSYSMQVKHLRKAKRIIESLSKRKIISFKAPALRINSFTIKALEEVGFLIDTSVASQRFDGPLSFGATQKIKWLFAPRLPYHPSLENPFVKGNSKILEIPISAYLIPFIGSIMRISQNLIKVLHKILIKESLKTGKPLVFIIHPNEVQDFNIRNNKIHKRGETLLQRVFADTLRYKIKTNCLGKCALKRMEEIIRYSKENGLTFTTAKDFREKYIKECDTL